MRGTRFLFRVDASLQIGNGHVMRCLTLARTLRQLGAECRFACQAQPGDLMNAIREAGHAVVALNSPEPALATNPSLASATGQMLGAAERRDAEATRAILREYAVDWLIVDHYSLGLEWESLLRPHVKHLMVIDDLADRSHRCDLLLDGNLGRSAGCYIGKVPLDCVVLAGPQFAPLRREFALLREKSLSRRTSPRLARLLISMGGTDTHNSTGRVLASLKRSQLPSGLRITVVLGQHAPWLKEVMGLAKQMPCRCEVKLDVSDMAWLMAESDVAIGAGGITSWERCTLGVPSLIVALAKNQESGAHALAQAGAACLLQTEFEAGRTLAVTLKGAGYPQLVRMSAAAASICDGYGAARVVTAVTALSGSARPMCERDMDDVLRWRNQPDVRRSMHTQHKITPEEHEQWFSMASADPNRHLLIIEDNCGPLGFVQFTRQDGGGARWGFYLAPDAPRGSGSTLGAVALDHAFRRLGFNKVIGEVIESNVKSMALHEKLGFRPVGTLRRRGEDSAALDHLPQFELLSDEWPLQSRTFRT